MTPASARAAGPVGGAVGAAVIAGGLATRMGGAAKSALAVGGRSIAADQLQTLRAVFARVLVVANDPAPWRELGVEVVADRERGVGPIGGVHAALLATRALAGGVVCVAGDMPFLSPDLLRLVRDRDPGAEAVVPRAGGRPEPLLARYAPGCLAVVEAQLAAGERAMQALLGRLRVSWIEEAELRVVDPELRALTNVNTPSDLARARSLSPRPRRSRR
jgi:molybdopterin-guanine dinucleotide biosynthesis protein A